jgi:predicted nucleic acid-binding protein
VIVVNASALLEVLLNTPAASRVAERLFAEGETLHAPHVLNLEVAQVLRRMPARADWTAIGDYKRSRISSICRSSVIHTICS